jgi:CheY-like chemotaxis protein
VDSTPGEGSRFQFVIPHPRVETRSQFIELAATRTVLLIGSGPEHDDLVEFLTQKGYEAAAAPTIPEGLGVMGNAIPAALILDLTKAGPEAWRILQDLRANERTAEVPVIALTAPDDQNAATALGANAALLKPINPALLLRVLDEKTVRSPGEPSRILVVDDEAAAREVIDETLRSAGFLPVLASTGKQALEALARGPIAAVVVDLIMPEMSGFELILRIRQNPRLADLPIVVLTAKEVDLDDAQLLNRQANAVFLKVCPWREEFLAKLDELVQHVINRDPIKG